MKANAVIEREMAGGLANQRVPLWLGRFAALACSTFAPLNHKSDYSSGAAVFWQPHLPFIRTSIEYL